MLIVDLNICLRKVFGHDCDGVLAQQRGERRGRQAAEDAGAGVQGDGVRE